MPTSVVNAEGYGVELQDTTYRFGDVGPLYGQKGAVVALTFARPGRQPYQHVHIAEDRLAQLGQAIQLYFARKAVNNAGG